MTDNSGSKEEYQQPTMDNIEEPPDTPIEEQLNREPPNTVSSENEDFETNATVIGSSTL